MFPLSEVVMPTQLLPLHVFEARYRVLMEILSAPGSPAEMGTVLIERGAEVGGGDSRLGTGTVLHLIEAEVLPDGRWVALFAGSHRLRVQTWLEDDPFPCAAVDDLADEAWQEAWSVLLSQAESAVRSALELAERLGETTLSPEFPLAPDPIVASWQLCAASPLGPLDRQSLLEAHSIPARLARLAERTLEKSQVLAFRLGQR